MSKDIVFLRPIHYAGPRIRRLMDVARELGYAVSFLAARRSLSAESVQAPPWVDSVFVGLYYPESSWRYLIGTPIYIVGSLFQLIRRRPAVVHVSDLEGAIPGAIYRKVFNRKTRLIINVHDNFFSRYRVSPFFKKLLKTLEAFVYQRADVLLFPDASRVALFSPIKLKPPVIVIPNVATGGAFAPVPLGNRIRLLVAGWLNWQRGFDVLLQTLDRNEDIELHVCGSGQEDLVARLKAHPRVRFYGVVDQSEVFRIGASCHIVPVLYRPDSEINIDATPNKLYDALVLGRPIIVNREIRMASLVDDWRAGELVSFGDIEQFEFAVRKITASQETFDATCVRSRRVYDSEFSPEKMVRLGELAIKGY